MIITKAPFRVSFFGGGSDISDFYLSHGGIVLSTSINKYMYISSHHFFDKHKIRLKYALTEDALSVEEIKHPIFKQVLKNFNITGALEFSSNADIPAGTGLGSSSAFTVALLLNAYTRYHHYFSKETLAATACDIEISQLKTPIGKQDQYASAFGGLNIIEFSSNDSVNVTPLHIKKTTYKALEENLLLFYTGQTRKASTLLKSQKEKYQDPATVETQLNMVAFVEKAKKALLTDDLDHFGHLLHEYWLLKKQLSQGISTSSIDTIYDTAIKNGAIGGKLLGAGHSGFMLFYCQKEKQTKLRMALSNYQELSFKFENDGAKVIYVGDEYRKH